jgi:hypothetical protein
MRNLVESIITHIPSVAAQLLPVGGVLALVGTTLIAVMVLWRRWATRASIAQSGRGQQGIVMLVEQLAAHTRISEEDVADMINNSALPYRSGLLDSRISTLEIPWVEGNRRRVPSGTDSSRGTGWDCSPAPDSRRTRTALFRFP